MVENLLTTLDLPALFALSFLAATLIPLGSEWLLIALILDNHALWPAVLTATMGNYLGACTTYIIGAWGDDFLTEKIVRISKSQQHKARRLYQKYGKWSLLFSWLPIVGDPLCLIGGIQHLNFWFFSILVLIGKFMRYAIIGSITWKSIN